MSASRSLTVDFQDWLSEREAAVADRTGTERIGDRERAILS